MKKLLTFLFVCAVLGMKFPDLAHAHVVKNIGTLGAVMHIAPQDDPTAGEETTFYLTFKDTAENMWLRDCNCTMSLKQDGEVVTTVQVEVDVVVEIVQVSTPTIIFPEIGVYELVVAGSPVDGISFEPFELVYPIRVARESVALKDRDTAENNQKYSEREKSVLQRQIIQLIISLSGVVCMVWLAVILTSSKVSK